jgi:hypothetical protein
MNNKKAKNAKRGGEKVEKSRTWKPYSTKRIWKLIWKIHEVVRDNSALSWNLKCATCQVDLEQSWTRFSKFMKLVEYSSNIGGKFMKVTWNLHGFEFALIWSHLIKGVMHCLTCRCTPSNLSDKEFKIEVNSLEDVFSFNFNGMYLFECQIPLIPLIPLLHGVFGLSMELSFLP